MKFFFYTTLFKSRVCLQYFTNSILILFSISSSFRRAFQGRSVNFMQCTKMTRRHDTPYVETKGLRKTIFLHVFGFQVYARAYRHATPLPLRVSRTRVSLCVMHGSPTLKWFPSSLMLTNSFYNPLVKTIYLEPGSLRPVLRASVQSFFHRYLSLS